MSTSPPQGQGSQTSLSPPGSQVDSSHQDVEIPLQQLISHLLASKRSLSSIDTVLRANELVTSARSLLETAVVVESRTQFIRRGISKQARDLRRLKDGVEVVYKDGVRDFQEVLQSLDAADLRLQKTMDVLRSTIVESAFRPEGEEPRSLLDFVDEAGVETMRSNLKDSIDQSQESQAIFLGSLTSFSHDLSRLKSSMVAPAPLSSRGNDTRGSSPIPPLLQNLENTAAEMAELLDSLVAHFDLCVNAIKHTEGGFAAVKQAASDKSSESAVQLPDGVTVSGVIRDAEAEVNPDEQEEISDEERKQMLTVLSNDAAEVEDVVIELHQLLANMEENFSSIQSHVTTLKNDYAATIAAFNILESISLTLPSYVSASAIFTSSWNAHKSAIADQMKEIESMRTFYEGYLTSYNNLILEVARRHSAEEKMKNVLRKAMEQVQKLHAVDRREREGFRKQVGDFLPADLWEGLKSDAPRWDINVLEEDDGIESTPLLERGVIEDAGRMERERSR